MTDNWMKERLALKEYLLDLAKRIENEEDVFEVLIFTHQRSGDKEKKLCTTRAKGWCHCTNVHLVRKMSECVSAFLNQTATNDSNPPDDSTGLVLGVGDDDDFDCEAEA